MPQYAKVPGPCSHEQGYRATPSKVIELDDVAEKQVAENWVEAQRATRVW